MPCQRQRTLHPRPCSCPCLPERRWAREVQAPRSEILTECGLDRGCSRGLPLVGELDAARHPVAFGLGNDADDAPHVPGDDRLREQQRAQALRFDRQLRKMRAGRPVVQHDGDVESRGRGESEPGVHPDLVAGLAAPGPSESRQPRVLGGGRQLRDARQCLHERRERILVGCELLVRVVVIDIGGSLELRDDRGAVLELLEEQIQANCAALRLRRPAGRTGSDELSVEVLPAHTLSGQRLHARGVDRLALQRRV